MYAALALAGAYLISFPSFVPQVYAGEVFNPNTMGVVLALSAALLWAASTVLGRYMLGSVDFKLLTALRFSIAFGFLLALNAAQGGLSAVSQLSGTDVLYMVIIACVSGVASLFIYYRGLSTTPASVATLAELGYPVAAVFINWLFIPGSALVPMQLVGVAILLGAMRVLVPEKGRKLEELLKLSSLQGQALIQVLLQETQTCYLDFKNSASC
jgi:drug/metabolite transporter (DMT)-like permease